ncbi:unnamed protein product [Leptosia nina]|uniref:Ubinuclein-1 n=1 Tax=Leptosia nina TaxID=320188 RepID=A0AAV1J2X2_9NEOP
MSDPKRAAIITVGAPKSVKNNVTKTVRLTINLDESNESKYPELNYKELVIVAAKKKRVENGKTAGLDPFSDNDDDVERVARKFEQKYGGNSTYGRKGRSKFEEFADIGAGYDENDSFIDNTHGYDEMIPPECDTLYGGFYINSGSLEFKTVPENQTPHSDGDRRNKRRISSSSSEEESSESSSDSDSQEPKEPKSLTNGNVDSHKTEHRKKKNKNNEKKKMKTISGTDSTLATSGKQTSDAGPGEGSSTSQSDSLTSKPAPSSENVVTSDSSREPEVKVEIKLPQIVSEALSDIEMLSRQYKEVPSKDFEGKTDQCVLRLEQNLNQSSSGNRERREAWSRAAKTLNCSRAKLLYRAKRLKNDLVASSQPAHNNTTNSASTNTATSRVTNNNTAVKRKASEDLEQLDEFTFLTAEEKEAKIVDSLQRLKALIDERKPEMIATYNAECERVQEERKKLQIASGEGGPHVDKRLPKRRFPWCPMSRALLARLSRLAGSPSAAASLLATRALPLFPAGFVRMPTLLRQADLNKEVKASDLKRQRLGSISHQSAQHLQTQPHQNNLQTFPEPIQFPSSLTVTTTTKPPEKPEKVSDKTTEKPNKEEDKYANPLFGKIFNSFAMNKDLVIENSVESKKEQPVSSITITPVPNKEKKEKKEPLIRVKSPAALNDMIKKDKKSKRDKETPVHMETKEKNNEISQKQIDNMKALENNIPHPALVPVHQSPTFAKPDKRPPEKKKKDVLIISDMDPLSDNQEPVAVDDSSSDIEVIEDRVSDKVGESDTVPSDKSDKGKIKVKSDKECKRASVDEFSKKDFEMLMKDLQEMENSQEQTKVAYNSFGGVITSAKHESSKQAYNRTVFESTNKNKFTERTSLKEIDGCNTVTG